MVEIIETTVFFSYMLVVLGIGIYASRRGSHDPHSFYLAGRRLGSIVFTFTIMASLLSAFTFFAIGSTASTTGLGVFLVFSFEVLFFGLTYSTLGAQVTKVGRKFDLLTPSEYLMDRFEKDTSGIAYLLMSVSFLTLLVAAQIIGGGIALQTLLGIPYTYGAISIAGFMAIYIHISGMQGVVWSDVLQGAMMFGGLVGSFILALAIVGPAALSSGVLQNTEAVFSPAGPFDSWTPLYVLTFGGTTFLGVINYPHTYQRFLAARSISSLRKSGMLLPLIGVPIMFTGAALGAWSVGIVPNPPNPDYVIPLMMDGLLPQVLFALIVSAAIAALMSTADSVLLSVSSMIARDIYGRYISTDLSENREVTIAQWLLVLLVIIALTIALLQPAGIFSITELAAVGHCVAFPALFISLFWERSTGAAAAASIVISTPVVFMFGFGLLPDPLFGMHFSFYVLLFSCFIFIITSFATTVSQSEKDYVSA